MGKERKYSLTYWLPNGRKITDQQLSFKSKNEAYKWLYSTDCKPLKVKYIGWK